MPHLSVWFVRASLLYLAGGFTLGALLLSNKGLGFNPLLMRYLPMHIELLLTGWLVQFALGGAYWVLPRLRLKTTSDPEGRGGETLAWAAFVLLNLGIGWVVSEAVLAVPGLMLIGRAAEAAAVLLFTAGAWRRVRTFRG